MRGLSGARAYAGLAPSIAIMSALFTLLSASDAKADDVSDFYKGKRLTMFVGSSPGDGTDLYGRLIARHMSRKLPGSPQVVATNVPGANGLVAANTPRRASIPTGLTGSATSTSM